MDEQSVASASQFSAMCFTPVFQLLPKELQFGSGFKMLDLKDVDIL